MKYAIKNFVSRCAWHPNIVCCILLLFFTSTAFAKNKTLKPPGYQDVPSKLPATVKQKLKQTEQDLLDLMKDCVFLAQLYDPKDTKVNTEGFCFYDHEAKTGIIAQNVCVAIYVFPGVELRTPFYREKGHWGTGDPCSKKSIVEKIRETKTDTTVNPITTLRFKRDEGIRVRILKDDFNIKKTFLNRTRAALLPQGNGKVKKK